MQAAPLAKKLYGNLGKTKPEQHAVLPGPATNCNAISPRNSRIKPTAYNVHITTIPQPDANIVGLTKTVRIKHHALAGGQTDDAPIQEIKSSSVARSRSTSPGPRSPDNRTAANQFNVCLPSIAAVNSTDAGGSDPELYTEDTPSGDIDTFRSMAGDNAEAEQSNGIQTESRIHKFLADMSEALGGSSTKTTAPGAADSSSKVQQLANVSMLQSDVLKRVKQVHHKHQFFLPYHKYIKQSQPALCPRGNILKFISF